jgi:hypothetical protein
MVNRFFDYKALSEQKEEDTAPDKWVSKYLNLHFEKVEKLEEDLTRLPTPGEIFFLQSDSSFNALHSSPL